MKVRSDNIQYFHLFGMNKFTSHLCFQIICYSWCSYATFLKHDQPLPFFCYTCYNIYLLSRRTFELFPLSCKRKIVGIYFLTFRSVTCELTLLGCHSLPWPIYLTWEYSKIMQLVTLQSTELLMVKTISRNFHRKKFDECWNLFQLFKPFNC